MDMNSGNILLQDKNYLVAKIAHMRSSICIDEDLPSYEIEARGAHYPMNHVSMPCQLCHSLVWQ